MADRPAPPSDITPQEFFEKYIPEQIENIPEEQKAEARERAGDFSTVIGFNITDADAQYSFHINEGDIEVKPGIDDAEMTIVTDEETWRELMIDRSANPQQLFMSGRIQIEGDMSIAMQLQNIMPEGMLM
ncbi:MAG: SCP2 sterol-binding domain-containing protein [Pseudomonadota bacterium]|nr:SCP2 sterol-binding domain-containing protein [Pseudomonadota bacterium]HJO35518.1 SCP2 sterol-binding domain-containing protein [Gammaproteobacteria bacterium]